MWEIDESDTFDVLFDDELVGVFFTRSDAELFVRAKEQEAAVVKLARETEVRFTESKVAEPKSDFFVGLGEWPTVPPMKEGQILVSSKDGPVAAVTPENWFMSAVDDLFVWDCNSVQAISIAEIREWYREWTGQPSTLSDEEIGEAIMSALRLATNEFAGYHEAERPVLSEAEFKAKMKEALKSTVFKPPVAKEFTCSVYSDDVQPDVVIEKK